MFIWYINTEIKTVSIMTYFLNITIISKIELETVGS